jgi:non-ribosomal peptide synthetase component F
MFLRQAEQTPQAVAATCGPQRLTYQELDRSSARLADLLLNRRIVPEARVGLCVERSLEMVAGILGILKSGAAYVPLDPDMPVERLQTIINDSGVALIVTSRKQFALMERLGTPSLLFEIDASFDQAFPASHGISLQQLAYVIYTSGSTGKPKGVAVSHRNLVHSTEARWHTYESQPEDYLLLSSFAFDSRLPGSFGF